MAHARTPTRFFTTDWLALLALAVVFVGFRLWFAHAGGSYLASTLDSAKQFLDPALLQHDLLSSLWYLHSQPPLFNLFLGLVLKAASDPAVLYELCFRISGLLIPLCMYATLALLGANRIAAFLVTLFFMLNPSLILYESLLYYTHVEGVLIIVAVFFLARWGSAANAVDLACFLAAADVPGADPLAVSPGVFRMLAWCCAFFCGVKTCRCAPLRWPVCLPCCRSWPGA